MESAPIFASVLMLSRAVEPARLHKLVPPGARRNTLSRMKSAAPFEWLHRVRFSDTDASGRIHYTAMLRFFEAAEVEFLRSLGVPYSVIQDGQTSYPRVRIECDYTGAVRDDDVVAIGVTVERVGRSSFTLAFDARVGAREAARGRITIVCMSIATQTSRPLPETLAAILRSRLEPE
jgi:YbgC/YbaW family acyl-CoA thioester hydrolase